MKFNVRILCEDKKMEQFNSLGREVILEYLLKKELELFLSDQKLKIISVKEEKEEEGILM